MVTVERRRTTWYWRLRNALPPSARSTARAVVDLPLSRVAGSVVSAAAPTPRVALTLDDGPEPDVTPKVLDVLARHDARCTFFFLSRRARQWPDLVAAAVEAGHEVALHGQDHRRVSRMTSAEAARYLREGKDVLEQAAGRPVTMFRPPYGAQSWASYTGARRAGLDVVVWSTDAADWVERPLDEVVDASLEVPRGGILLLHERLEPDPEHPDPVAGNPVTTFDRVGLVERVTLGLQERGGTVVGVGGLGPVRRTAWFRP